MAAKRVGDEPAFILHRYDWSESSLILEVFTRHRGRVALLAKGVKRHTSNFRPVLLALQPLKVSYTLSGDGNADIHVLKGAEWAGGHIMPMGNNLLTGLYLNELLMRLLARDDPYAYLFDVYGAVVKLLATQQEEVIEPVLRAFELILLRELGLPQRWSWKRRCCRRWSRKSLMCWWPRWVCARRWTATVPASPGCSGAACSTRWSRVRPLTPPLCVPVQRWHRH